MHVHLLFILCLLLLPLFFLFFFNDTATTEIYTLSLHDALPICLINDAALRNSPILIPAFAVGRTQEIIYLIRELEDEKDRKSTRLNSSHLVISYAVFCLKKKKKNRMTIL